MNKKLNIKRVFFDSFLLFLSIFAFSIKNTEIKISSINTFVGVKQKYIEREKSILKITKKVFIKYSNKIITNCCIIFQEKIVPKLVIILFSSQFYKDLFRIKW